MSEQLPEPGEQSWEKLVSTHEFHEAGCPGALSVDSEEEMTRKADGWGTQAEGC